MRVFADHCVPTDVIEVLRDLGIEVQRAFEIGLERAPDAVLFYHAKKTGRVLLSFDLDFGNMVRFDVTHSPGIIIIEAERFSKILLRKRTREVFHELREPAVRGRLLIVDPSRIRTWSKSRG